jgi:single-strand DNA-binding protein
MWGVNRATLIGNVGQVEPRQSGDDKLIVNIRLATSRTYKDSSGESREQTEWHSVVAFGRLAEIADAHITVGSPLYVDGEIRYRTYTDKDGVERHATSIVANEIRLLGGRQRDAEPQQNTGKSASPPASRDTNSPRQNTNARSPGQSQGQTQGGFNRRPDNQSSSRQRQPAARDEFPEDADIPF